MRSWTLAFCLAGSIWASQAEAGHGLFKHRAAYAAPVATAATEAPCAACQAAQAGGYAGSGSMGSSTGGSIDGQGMPPIRPYSYYAAQPGTARGYYGYGEDQFPYYGRPYGHPYDPWTWPYMSGAYQNSLNRYYSPPL